jgi:hypothetical protein
MKVSKYNPEDVVYFLNDNKIIDRTIIRVFTTITISRKEKSKHTKYELNHWSINLDEENLFSSREALIKSL